MKKSILFCLTILFISSCAPRKKPEYLKVDNIKIIGISKDNVVLGADVFFNNPNSIGGTIETKGIKVLVNGEQLAEVSSESFKVPARKEFAVPIKVDIPTAKLFQKKDDNLLNNILNIISQKKVTIQLKGNVKYRVLGSSHRYPVNITKDLKIKL